MQNSQTHSTIWRRLWHQVRPLLTWKSVDQPWGFLVMTALSVGTPVIIGAWLQQFGASIVASMGGLAILYMRQTAIAHRMISLGLASFGFCVCFTAGILTSFNPYLSAFTLGLTVFFVTLVCRFFSVPPPGTFFFILVACIARAMPFDPALVAERTGILLFGCMWACLLALGYSVGQACFFRKITAQGVQPGDSRIQAIILESAVIALFVGGGYLFSLIVELDNPYWVPVSCAAIMQGATFRAVWHRNVHRIVGTALGMGLAWIIFSLSPGVWTLALLIMLLSFVIEALVPRNYGLAVVFITPITLIFADTSAAISSPEHLIQARLVDIIIGSSIGYIGGWIIHKQALFNSLEALMMKWRDRQK